MTKENNIVLTGVFTKTMVTNTFEKQEIVFASKDRDGQWRDGGFELYIKPDLLQQTAVQAGDTIKVKGFLVFSFFTKADGTQMSFPKMIVTEVLEVEKAGAAGAQPTQPQTMVPQPQSMQPPVPGTAPTMPPPMVPPMAAQAQVGVPPMAAQAQAAEAFPTPTGYPVPPQPAA